jgi:hypothetical protein
MNHADTEAGDQTYTYRTPGIAGTQRLSMTGHPEARGNNVFPQTGIAATLGILRAPSEQPYTPYKPAQPPCPGVPMPRHAAGKAVKSGLQQLATDPRTQVMS